MVNAGAILGGLIPGAPDQGRARVASAPASWDRERAVAWLWGTWKFFFLLLASLVATYSKAGEGGCTWIAGEPTTSYREI